MARPCVDGLIYLQSAVKQQFRVLVLFVSAGLVSMTEKNTEIKRIHHFYVAYSKYLFLHPAHGIVYVDDPIRLKDAERYGLRPLLLYGLVVAGLPLKWMTFSPADQPRAFSDVLLDAWRSAKGLRGHPDILLINRHLAAACPTLATKMEKIGVEVRVADAKEKSLPANLRAAQDSCKSLREEINSNNLDTTDSVKQLCFSALEQHNLDCVLFDSGRHSFEKTCQIYDWLKLPKRKPDENINSPIIDWDIGTGKWLSSWESSLPPDQPRSLFTSAETRITRLRTGSAWSSTQQYICDDSDDSFPELVESIVSCWPNSLSDIAEFADLTRRELEGLINGVCDPDSPVFLKLRNLLSIEYDEDFDRYVLAGPYVLIARSPDDVERVYDNHSCGGNALPCEIIPDVGTADPSWRYVLIINPGWAPSILMTPRGGDITEELPDLLLNFGGCRTAPAEVYRRIVSVCALACLSPESNSQEIWGFYKDYVRFGLNTLWDRRF